MDFIFLSWKNNFTTPQKKKTIKVQVPLFGIRFFVFWKILKYIQDFFFQITTLSSPYKATSKTETFRFGGNVLISL